ncbi:MAG: 7-cyano-7-deazaguanine synthase QueC, partial [Gammaproteobacteria bacterium]
MKFAKSNVVANMKKAVVVFSGGVDSTTCLAIAKAEGYIPHALSFDYGQRHRAELQAAKKIAQYMQVAEHRIVNMNIGALTQSALTDNAIVVPETPVSDDIPSTYVPARNTIFLAIALGWAEVIGAQDIFIGVSAIDYSNYPDCRPEFIAAFEHLAMLATKAGTEDAKFYIRTPLIALSKADTIKIGSQYGVDYGMTVSCYQADAEGRACGRCHSCQFRKKGFVEAGIADPTRY